MPVLPLFYRIAAVLMVLNAALHALTFIPDAGFNGTAQLLMPFAPLYLLLAWGLWRQSRTVAWLQFFTALVGAVLAYLFKPLFALPEVWAWALVITDVDVAVLMLLILWPSRQRASAGA
ncbi:hypothetical protein N9M21_00395 [Alphaproteobacteria bacterium]|nr:hypothetical protein [Alphaproteobacteria bacterium]